MPFDQKGNIYVYDPGDVSSFLITLILTLFSIIETFAFVNIGTYIAPQKAKRNTSIILATLKCLGTFSTLGGALRVTDDLKLIETLPVIAALVTAAICIRKKDTNEEERNFIHITKRRVIVIAICIAGILFMVVKR